MSPDQFIAAISAAAQASAKTTKVPASFVVAQAALESAWGTSRLSLEGKNLFGVKADKGWKGPVITMPTREFVGGKWITVLAPWRKYATWLDCINDHADFFIKNPRYKPCFSCETAEGFAEAVANAGYATDPQYAQKVISVMRAHNLSTLDV